MVITEKPQSLPSGHSWLNVKMVQGSVRAVVYMVPLQNSQTSLSQPTPLPASRKGSHSAYPISLG